MDKQEKLHTYILKDLKKNSEIVYSYCGGTRRTCQSITTPSKLVVRPYDIYILKNELLNKTYSQIKGVYGLTDEECTKLSHKYFDFVGETLSVRESLKVV
jgi:hypothetical protein